VGAAGAQGGACAVTTSSSARGCAGSLCPAIPAFALIIDAKDEKAAAIYRHQDFTALQGNPLALLLPVAIAARLAGR